MKDFYKLYSVEQSGKSTKKPYSRGKSFGYQILGFGSGVPDTGVAHRGVWGGAFLADSSTSDVIDFVVIATLGDATDFGNQSVARSRNHSGAASSTRGLFFGGNTAGSPAVRRNIIDYVTIATAGNATDFGDCSSTTQMGTAGNNDTRAVHALGDTSDNSVNTLEYVTIGSTGNTTDFGDLSLDRNAAAGCSSNTRICYAGGYSYSASGTTNTIDYITTGSTGNASDFGDLTVVRSALSACSSSTRGVWAAGNDASGNVIDYVTIASAGNASDFGDLSSVAEDSSGGTSNKIRGLFAKGGTPSRDKAIDYITIASTGNGADFGDRTVAGTYAAACSNGNGGLA